MALTATAELIVRYLGSREGPVAEEHVRTSLALSAEAYELAVQELADYGLVGSALAMGQEGALTLTEAGRRALEQDLAPTSLPLTPASLARNPLVAASWAIEREAVDLALPERRAELAEEIVRAVQGLLVIAGECLPAPALEEARAAADALQAQVREDHPPVATIRRCLRVLAFPDGAATFASPLVAALPGLAIALDSLLAPSGETDQVA